MTRKGDKAPGTGWGNPDHPMHRAKGGGVPVPYEPGNTAAVLHGGRSRSNRLVMPEAEAILAETVAEVGYLADPSYRPALEAWAIAVAWCDRLGRWVEEHGAIEESGKVKPVLDHLRLWQQRASAEADRLGLTPLARAKLGRDVTAARVDLAMVFAEIAKQQEGK